MNELVYGFGVSDGSRPARLDKKSMTKEYSLWKSILERCFSPKMQDKCPTYKGCKVSVNFLNYAYFYDWCQMQVGFGKQGWALDKDILIAGNKLYSENTCCFVPQEINKLLTIRGNDRGSFKLGVDLHRTSGKYRSRCSERGNLRHLGYFNTEQEAFKVYKDFKEKHIKSLAEEYKHQLDPRAYEALMNYQVEETD